MTAVLINSLLAAEDKLEANVTIDKIFVDLACWTLPTKTSTGREIIFNAAGHKNHFHVRLVDPDGPYN